MGSYIAPATFNSKNNPIELASDYTGTTLILKLGHSGDTTAYFNGKFYKKPGETYIGVDIQKYVKDIVNFESFTFDYSWFFISEITQTINNFINDVYFRFEDLNGVLKYSGTTKIVNENWKFSEFLTYKLGSRVGNKILNTFDPNMQNDYFDIVMYNLFSDTKQDPFLNEFNFTYNTFTDSPQVRQWNKSLYGALIPIMIMNTSASSYGGYFYASYYADKFSSGTTKYTWNLTDPAPNKTGYTYITFPSMTLLNWTLYPYELFSYNNLNYKYISFDFHLASDPGSGGVSRSIFTEILGTYDNRCYDKYQLYWLNRFGGVDWIVMDKKVTKTTKVERSQYNKTIRSFTNGAFVGDLKTDSHPQYLSENQLEYELNSDLLGYEYKYLEDLFTSPKVWIYNERFSEGDLRLVEVIDTDYVSKTFDNQKNTYNLNIKVREKIKNTFL